ncbi:MAG: peptide deformylase [Deltaproteobacteria bacterium]|nr:peptide deformylase [Deltaproteobacteria bacterium]
MIREIVLYPDPLLKEQCDPVEEIDAALHRLLDDMAETMYSADGIGLAAPQIGVLSRVIVIDLGSDEEIGRPNQLLEFINPVILEREGDTEYDEGCLSIPGIREVIRRSARIKVQALDRDGKEFVMNTDGLLAIALQHEIDHINGVLFIDRIGTAKREMLRPLLRELVERYASQSRAR